MENSPLPLFIDTPSEWLENIFDRASIFLAMQCRDNLKIVADELQRGYLWLMDNNNPLWFEFLRLLNVVSTAIWGIIND